MTLLLHFFIPKGVSFQVDFVFLWQQWCYILDYEAQFGRSFQCLCSLERSILVCCSGLFVDQPVCFRSRKLDAWRCFVAPFDGSEILHVLQVATSVFHGSTFLQPCSLFEDAWRSCLLAVVCGCHRGNSPLRDRQCLVFQSRFRPRAPGCGCALSPLAAVCGGCLLREIPRASSLARHPSIGSVLVGVHLCAGCLPPPGHADLVFVQHVGVPAYTGQSPRTATHDGGEETDSCRPGSEKSLKAWIFLPNAFQNLRFFAIFAE